MPAEIPLKCEECGNEDLIHGLKLYKVNSLLSTGGPAQEPPVMGPQWALYMCPICDAIYPYKKYYPGTRELQATYEKLHKFFKERLDRRISLNEKSKKIEALIESSKTLSSLPGGASGLEAMLSQVIGPLRERVELLEGEAKKRKGGRPKKEKKNA
jgi:hypothetical protein